MIKATKELLDYLELEKDLQLWQVISAYANVIANYGDLEDGELVGEYLLKNQGNYSLSALYAVVLKLGSKDLAEKFFQMAISEGQLKEGYDLEILEVLGKFQLKNAKQMLVEYALGDSMYYTNRYAVKGLLYQDCEDIQERIRTSIESVYGKGLFNEEMPSLVCKLKDRADVLERLYETGSESCSSDCNGGIFLGFSLCGEEGLPYFKKAMFNPFWEAHYPPRHHVVEGMRNLGITFLEVFKEIQAFADLDKQEYGLKVLLSLLEVRLESEMTEVDAGESYKDLMYSLFTLRDGNYSGDLAEFAEKFGRREEAYDLESLLRFRLREEAFFRCF